MTKWAGEEIETAVKPLTDFWRYLLTAALAGSQRNEDALNVDLWTVSISIVDMSKAYRLEVLFPT
jgi:hypothetical protein